jgi:hypothetical protein
MEKFNSQLPEVRPPQPHKVDWFSSHYMWGYAFLGLSFILAIAFINQMEYGSQPQEAQVCIQVVTPAKNQTTGEVKDFPTPCDVPEGWQPVSNMYNISDQNLPIREYSQEPGIIDSSGVYTSSALNFQVKVLGSKVEAELNDSTNRLVYFAGKHNFEVRFKDAGIFTGSSEFPYLDQNPTRFSRLAGYPANVFENSVGYCDGPGCSDPYVAYIAQINNDLVHLIFYGDAKVSNEEQLIIDSFKIN